MIRNPARCLLPLLAALAAVPAAAAAPSPPSGQQQNGTHPDSHAPAPPPAPARRPMRQPARYSTGHGHVTAGHVSRCKHHYRSYNSRTNRYTGYSGARHVCVL